MRKISSYLYPNRIQLLADVAGFTTEYTNVYQRTVKIYQGVDNVIEFDIKNADQKRIDLVTSPVITQLEMNVMDAMGTELPNSPYTITPHETIKGIGVAVIPHADLNDLDHQFFNYSVTATKDGYTIPLYADSRFGAVGTIELVGNAMPTFRDARVYKTYTGEIDLDGNVINHFPVISSKFYEAVTTTQLDFSIDVTGFIGTIWLEGTTNDTISVNSFLHAVRLRSQTLTTATTTTVSFANVDINDFANFRVSFQGDSPLTPTGKVDKVTVE